MAAAIVFLMCWAVLMTAEDTPIRRFLYRVMVAIPANAASRLRRIDIAVGIVILLLIVLHFSAGDADPIRLISLAAPDLAIWLTSFEISALLDAAAALAAALTVLRRANIHQALVTLGFVKRPERRANAARRVRLRDRASAANDDDDGAEFALAS